MKCWHAVQTFHLILNYKLQMLNHWSSFLLAQRNNTTLLNDRDQPKFHKDKKWMNFLPKEVHIFLASFGDMSAENQNEVIKMICSFVFLKIWSFWWFQIASYWVSDYQGIGDLIFIALLPRSDIAYHDKHAIFVIYNHSMAKQQLQRNASTNFNCFQLQAVWDGSRKLRF